jgi:hypothetical protein
VTPRCQDVDMDYIPELKRLSYVMADEPFRRLLTSFGVKVSRANPQDSFRSIYRSTMCDRNNWPKAFPLINEKTVREGIAVFSISGKIHGRTTGNRRKCASKSCPGWFVEVQWETGQKFWPCSEGWHYSVDEAGEPRIDIIGGGEISARFISPNPLGTHPLDKSEWPTKTELRKMRGWRVAR